MSQFFWERIRKARARYLCDQCSGSIYPGYLYEYKAWRVKGGFVIQRIHLDPECELEEQEEGAEEFFQPVVLETSIVIVCEAVEVLKTKMDGSLVVETEIVFTSKVITETAVMDEEDEDLIF